MGQKCRNRCHRPGALDPEIRTLGDHLALSRDLLIALADPMRQDLVQILARAELNVGEIADHVTLSRPTVSHHLNILRRAGRVVSHCEITSRLPIGWWERAAHWSEETSDELLGSIGS
jgi:DNA-binding transcriptional ArsR family regulator